MRQKYTVLLIISSILISSSFGLYEKEKGLNDWRIENLGEIKDMKFIENSPYIYTISTTGLLSLFDTERQ